MENNNKEKILASACLLGECVRHDAQILRITDQRIFQWGRERRFLPICPECMAGLLVPREQCEIEAGKTAEDVLNGTARIMTKSGKDCTEDILFGVQASVGMAKRNNARVALIKQSGTSCGAKNIYDGSFSGQLNAGMGILTAMLKKEGILVFDETEIDALENALND
jgi:uncharacterized protein YbbK (DUF523 family)